MPIPNPMLDSAGLDTTTIPRDTVACLETSQITRYGSAHAMKLEDIYIHVGARIRRSSLHPYIILRCTHRARDSHYNSVGVSSSDFH